MNDLDILINNVINNGYTWAAVVNEIKRNNDYLDLLIAETPYLPETSSISERLYCYKEHVISNPECPDCHTHLEFQKISHGYKRTCPNCGKTKIQIRTTVPVTTTVADELPEYKKYALSSNKVKKGTTYESVIKAKFPAIYEYCSGESFKEKLYMLLFDIKEQPKCPICGKPTPLRNFQIGFQQTCSKECQAIFFKSNKEAHQKISYTRKSQKSGKRQWLYEYNYEFDGNYTIFKGYCEHGDTRVYTSLLDKIKNTGEATMCMECNYKIYQEYNPSEEETEQFINEFPEFYKKHHNAVNWDFWMRYYPKKLKILVNYFEKHIRKFNGKEDLPEVYHVVINRLLTDPKCPICGRPITLFHGSTRCYATHCQEHLYTCNNSVGETELKSYIESLGFKTEINRDILNGQEIDIYIPELKVGFEYNGCYFHSTEYKEKDYHFRKKQIAKEAGIDLYFIWEDDWQNKQDLIKSLIKSKLGAIKNKVYARNCKLKELSYQEAYDFLENNHLNGYAIAAYKLGLFYNDELVCVMTLGKSRFNKDEMEIIRFANKLGITVIGGASKLFSYFKKKYLNNRKCISFAHNDISNGNMYIKLGFKKIADTESWSWLYKGIRYNRLNKIKDTQKGNLLQCYNSGVSKYVYE